MKRYNVRLGSGSMMLSEADIAVLYQSGGVTNDTPCSEVGKDWWRTIDEMFPLLKHEGSAAGRYQSPAVILQRSSSNSAIVAGWICFGIGASISWIFPPGYIFFSVAVVMAIVAMATHQVSRGLILLLSSLLGLAVSVVISFVLAIGLFATAAGHVITKAEETSKKEQAAVTQPLNAFSQAQPAATPGPASPSSHFPAPAQTAVQAKPRSTARPATIAPASQDDLTRQLQQMNQSSTNLSHSMPQAPSNRRPRLASTTLPSVPRAMQATTPPASDTSVEAQLLRIEQQKQKRESYKLRHAALHKSIDLWEEQARKSKKERREYAEKQADALRKELQKLNNEHIGM
ncbi:MAG TPA: hypothetical protein VF585_12180 [Chthoniobacterales bacterium]